MAAIIPFHCIRPDEKAAHRVAALPYDVFSRQEAKMEVMREPMSFLKVDRAETQFDDDIDAYDDRVYDKARKILDDMVSDRVLIYDEEKCYYVYELVMNGRPQTGITACASIDDYLNGVIKKHENTREEKERDRIHHVERCNAQTGPIFLAYHSNKVINAVVDSVKREVPLYHFTAPDGVVHNVWKIHGEDRMQEVEHAFAEIDHIYIADGHHRAASAVKAGLKRREGGCTGAEEFNYFLSVVFPDDQLMIMPYNRVVRDLNGYSPAQFLEKIGENFEVSPIEGGRFAPGQKAVFGMYLDGRWYKLSANKALKSIDDAVESLDVSLLQDYLFDPILNIKDPRVDDRMDFVGGIRGLEELEKRVDQDMAAAFALYPTSAAELFRVADSGRLMPPKSTWFEPKLRSGLFIHPL